jgi:transposase
VASAEKKAAEEKRTIVWVDQSGFYLLPMAVRTWAPVGQTPVLRVKLTRDHLAAISGITPDGRLVMQVQDRAYRAEDVVRFLQLLLRKIGGKLLVIWDGSPIHRRAEVNEFVSQTRGKIWLEALPGYAPDLNPWDEGGWHHLKDVEMRNLVCRDLEELHQEFDLAVGRLREKPQLIQSFFAQAGLKIEEE